MNSRQRRQDQKLWRYHIEVQINDYNHYEEMWTWLVEKHGKKIGRCGWRDRKICEVDYIHWLDHDPIRIRWEFIDERDATEFALRWA